MGWSAENILALLTLAITIPTSIIGTCALLNWWRQRQTGKKTKWQSTADPRSAALGDLEMVPVPRASRRHSWLDRTTSASLEEGMFLESYHYVQRFGRVEVRRPSPQP
ncbi:hypothetical protein BJX66DRAFT_317250 [Aspergillus keveii]|uniref:Uncharacterized protein n=1 Tax=Aspergillus keveii TaxID=714993 RepID=A0ABR4FM31_9EURO